MNNILFFYVVSLHSNHKNGIVFERVVTKKPQAFIVIQFVCECCLFVTMVKHLERHATAATTTETKTVTFKTACK